ncbi:MAG: histidine kinase [Clostridia bacterium]|nr:histidine kinase [Clostridia bacterium]
MYELISVLSVAMCFAGLALGLLGQFFTFIDRTMEPWVRRFFARFFFVMILCAASGTIFECLYNVPGHRTAAQLFLYLESLFSSLLMPMLTIYLLHCCNEDWRKNPFLDGVLALWMIYFIMLTVTQFTDLIYYFEPENIYRRGPWYPVLLAPPVLTMGHILAGLLRRRRMLSRKQFLAFLLYILLPAAGMVIQMLFFGLPFIVFASALAGGCMVLIILRDQADRQVLQQKELARQRASILVLQMRPHFIYNVMMSVYYLCKQDADKAQQVILDFTSYLRQNFTAIAREDTVPFAEELEHTRAYLAVEQVRFEERLFVTFDTPHTQFHIPPLTLQPIVENAVKHGVDPELSPLRITVSTRAVENGSLITVEDTGPGFTDADDDRPHIALRNIRERLQTMLGGRLEIEPRPGGGTVVTVFVPDGKNS